VILRPEAPATALDRAEGWRYLSRLTRAALERSIEFDDPDFPVFYALSHTTIKIGSDNPDNIYRNANIAGDREYRIWGRRGSAHYLSFGTKAERYSTDGTSASTGELNGRDLELGPDGSFEIIVSARRQDGNWLPMADDSTMLLVRETFLDRSRETPGEMQIECLARPAKPLPLSAEAMDRGLQAAAAFVHGTAKTFADWAQLFAERPNELPRMDQTLFWRGGGDPNIFYYHGYWRLKPDEALVIETEVPDCDYWNIQINNYWDESLDYRYLPVSVNKHTARYNPDGSVTLVCAAEDPGIGSFLDTAGHTSGILLLRWVYAKTHPEPRCRVVKLAELKTG
jgi:hypothetical protein